MEPFGFIILAIVFASSARKAVEDLSFAVRGKTSPRMEMRQQALAAAAANGGKPVRYGAWGYLADLWDAGWRDRGQRRARRRAEAAASGASTRSRGPMRRYVGARWGTVWGKAETKHRARYADWQRKRGLDPDTDPGLDRTFDTVPRDQSVRPVVADGVDQKPFDPISCDPRHSANELFAVDDLNKYVDNLRRRGRIHPEDERSVADWLENHRMQAADHNTITTGFGTCESVHDDLQNWLTEPNNPSRAYFYARKTQEKRLKEQEEFPDFPELTGDDRTNVDTGTDDDGGLKQFIEGHTKSDRYVQDLAQRWYSEKLTNQEFYQRLREQEDGIPAEQRYKAAWRLHPGNPQPVSPIDGESWPVPDLESPTATGNKDRLRHPRCQWSDGELSDAEFVEAARQHCTSTKQLGDALDYAWRHHPDYNPDQLNPLHLADSQAAAPPQDGGLATVIPLHGKDTTVTDANNTESELYDLESTKWWAEKNHERLAGMDEAMNDAREQLRLQGVGGKTNDSEDPLVVMTELADLYEQLHTATGKLNELLGQQDIIADAYETVQNGGNKEWLTGQK